jgi:hypothetical protein
MTFERLTKEIDVLTYNARSVLNAMIRSVLRYGTSNGYTVTKNSVELKLTRNDIYLLYRLYNEWAGLGFGKDTFEAACDNVRENFMSATNANPLLVADADSDELLHAVVTHSKIMFLNSSNKKEDNAYWIELIINAADKTAILNTCPIPINLRTPVFDENMEVDKYSQYETYLLPMGYYMSLILGSSGDEVDHVAGGRNWWFDVDNEFKVSAPSVVLGGDNGTDRYTYRCAKDDTGNLDTSPSYGLTYGYNTKLRGMYDTVGGSNTYVFGDSSHGISNSSMIQARYAGIYAGLRNQVHESNGMTAGGEDLVVLGSHGFAANRFNSVGYPGLIFKVPNLSKIDSECEVVVNVCESDTARTLTKYNPTNILDIYNRQNELTPVVWSNFEIGDQVIIYDQTINGKNYLSWFGVELRHQITTITGIDRSNGLFTRFILKDNIRFSEIGVDGGRIAKYSSNKYISYTYEYSGSSEVKTRRFFGANSTALNYLTIAAGFNQTVVGAANYPLVNPNFIVGTGYIPEGDELQTQYVGVGVFGSDSDGYIHSKVYRRNAFMVARDYIHAATSSYIMAGMVNDQTQTDVSHWVSTTDNKNHRELYLEVTDGSLEVACNDPNDATLDTSDYQQYHTSHIGLSNNRMMIGRFTNRSLDADKSCLAAINFYDKTWFNEHGDVNSNNMPRNTALELIGENAIRELKTNFNITNGFVTKDGYICQSRYAPEGSYGVWHDNAVSGGMYSENEYIAISSANTLSLYSANLVMLDSKSRVHIDGPRLTIDRMTSTIGTLALTGDAKSHCHDWICGCAMVNGKQEPDFARVMYGGFMIATKNDVHYGCTQYILPSRDGTCWGLDEFSAGDNASAHIFSSVGGSNSGIPGYDTSCSTESVKLILPGPSYVDHIHPVLMRYKEAEYTNGTKITDEIMKVDKLALVDDVVVRSTLRGNNNCTDKQTRWVKIAEVCVPHPENGIQCYVAGSFIVMASGIDGCAKREVHFNMVGLSDADGNVKYNAYCSIDGRNREDETLHGGCGKVRAILTNTPSDTVSAYYDIWIEIYYPDFFTVYQSSVTEGQGSIRWTNGYYTLDTMEQATDYVKHTTPVSEITGRGDSTIELIS